LPILICTSTLIEGVNTAAKSVLIYDKKINREDYDFFTFSNIRGRAGRLGQHHVGQVFLFHAPPDQSVVEVQPPLFGDLDEAPDELVVHISDEDASPTVAERVTNLARQLELSAGELRLASSVGIDVASELRSATATASAAGAAIHWSGYARYNNLEALCAVVCSVRNPNEFGVFSYRQLAYMINALRVTPTMKAFFLQQDASYRGAASGRDNIFRFLRACEYGLPQLFAVVEIFAKRLDSETDYSVLLAELPRWFRSDVLKNLDEQGVPIQISERFFDQNDNLDTLITRLKSAVLVADGRLSEFERQWVADALV
jgi:hypothetical protein